MSRSAQWSIDNVHPILRSLLRAAGCNDIRPTRQECGSWNHHSAQLLHRGLAMLSRRNVRCEERRPDLVIFDCDGVLIESERIAVRVEATQLTKLGWPLTEADVVERFSGRSEQYVVQEVAVRLGDRIAKAWIAEFWDAYWAACATELRPVDGVIDVLDRIGVQTCVASSSSHEYLHRVLGLVGLFDRFDGRIFSASDVPRGKPAPDLFLHAAARLDVSPRSCAVVEDSPAGVEAARSAGMRVFAYASGLHLIDRLEGLGTTVFCEMRELPQLLGFGDGLA